MRTLCERKIQRGELRATLRPGSRSPVLAACAILLHTGSLGAQTVCVWGDDAYGQVSDAPVDAWKIAGSAPLQGLAIRDDGSLVLWGGRDAPAAIPAIPTEYGNDTFNYAAAGRHVAAAIRHDGTVAVWGDDGNTAWPVPAVPPELQTMTFESVAVGLAHALGITADGVLHGWGNYVHADAEVLPVFVPAGAFRRVDSYLWWNLGLRADGRLLFWGYRDLDGLRSDLRQEIEANWNREGDPPVWTAPGKYRWMDWGIMHIAAVRKDGRIAVFGSDLHGQGYVPPGKGFRRVAAGSGFSVALHRDGTLTGWGSVAQFFHGPTPGDPFISWASADGVRFVAPGRYEAVETGVYHVTAIADDSRGNAVPPC